MITQLWRYEARIFLKWIAIIYGIFFSLIFFFDFIELIRRTTLNDQVSWRLILTLSFLHTPPVSLEVLPLIPLFGGILTLRQLNTRFELIAARACGASLTQLLLPLGVVSGLLGLGVWVTLDPLSSFFLQSYGKLTESHLNWKLESFSITDSGIWYRSPDKNHLLHASAANPNDNTLSKVDLFTLTENGDLTQISSANQVYLPRWQAEHILSLSLKNPQEQHKIESETWPAFFTFSSLQDRFTPPEALSLFDLPYFIELLEKAGFPSIRYRLRLARLILLPLMLASMALLPGYYGFSWKRQGLWGKNLFKTLLFGFGIFIFGRILEGLSLRHLLPVLLAVSLPPLCAGSIAWIRLAKKELRV